MRRVRVRAKKEKHLPAIVQVWIERVKELEHFVSKQRAILEKKDYNLETMEERHKVELRNVAKDYQSKIGSLTSELAITKRNNMIEEFTTLSQQFSELETDFEEMKTVHGELSNEYAALEESIDEDRIGAYSFDITVNPSRPCKMVNVSVEIKNNVGIPIFKDVSVTYSGKIRLNIQARDFVHSLITSDQHFALMSLQNMGNVLFDPAILES